MCIRDRVIGYRFLPDHPIAEAGAQASEQKSEGEKLSRWKEIVAVSYTHLDVYKRQVL